MTERREESRRYKILKNVVQCPIEQSSPRILVKEHLAAVVIRRWLCRQNGDRHGFEYTDRGSSRSLHSLFGLIQSLGRCVLRRGL